MHAENLIIAQRKHLLQRMIRLSSLAPKLPMVPCVLSRRASMLLTLRCAFLYQDGASARRDLALRPIL